jgi:hypothetical protein
VESETIEDKIREVLVSEIERQLGQRPSGETQAVTINGTLNLDDITAAVTAALAGGP